MSSSQATRLLVNSFTRQLVHLSTRSLVNSFTLFIALKGKYKKLQ